MDVLDLVGGYPYEYARPGQVREFLESRGLRLVIAGVMIISFAVRIYNAIERFRSPVTVHQGGLGLVIAIVGACVNVVLWRRIYLIACAEHSPVKESQWRLYRAKTMTNLCVILSLGLSLALRR